MKTLSLLRQDDAGFIISAELVIVATLLVVGVIVGLAEVQHAVISELNDVGDAIGSLDQSYQYRGLAKGSSGGWGWGVGIRKGWGLGWGRGGCRFAWTAGSAFVDRADDCDFGSFDIECDHPDVHGFRHHDHRLYRDRDGDHHDPRDHDRFRRGRDNG